MPRNLPGKTTDRHCPVLACGSVCAVVYNVVLIFKFKGETHKCDCWNVEWKLFSNCFLWCCSVLIDFCNERGRVGAVRSTIGMTRD